MIVVLAVIKRGGGEGCGGCASDTINVSTMVVVVVVVVAAVVLAAVVVVQRCWWRRW